ncbi:1219_t:CDS:2, partial [Racocetra fulgida]
MPPLPINLAAVSIAFINAVLKNEDESNDRVTNPNKAQQNKLLTSSAEKELYDESISLRDKIDIIFTETDNVSRDINDSELITALQENRVIMQEVYNTRYVVETLEYLIEVQNSAKRFQEYLIQGRIEEAAASITYM